MEEQKRKAVMMYEEDVLNLNNIREILLAAAKNGDRDVRPEMLTLNGLIKQFEEKPINSNLTEVAVL